MAKGGYRIFDTRNTTFTEDVATKVEKAFETVSNAHGKAILVSECTYSSEDTGELKLSEFFTLFRKQPNGDFLAGVQLGLVDITIKVESNDNVTFAFR